MVNSGPIMNSGLPVGGYCRAPRISFELLIKRGIY